MDRREFIIAASAIIAGCSREAEPDATATGGTAALGVQLYTVRELMAEDIVATLELVAGIGYREVEFAGYFDHSPGELRRHLDRAGLSAPSAHVSYSDFVEDADRVIDSAVEIGHRFLVVAYLKEDQRTSLDDYRRHCENFNRWGEACAKAGLKFAYHNHMFEFDEVDDEIPYDVLLSDTDPGLVDMELDLAWARGGNADPIAYFKAWPGRFPMFHLKDINNDKTEVDIGDGDVAFANILEHAELAGLRHGYVERDHPADAEDSLERNYDTILPLWAKYMQPA